MPGALFEATPAGVKQKLTIIKIIPKIVSNRISMANTIAKITCITIELVKEIFHPSRPQNMLVCVCRLDEQR